MDRKRSRPVIWGNEASNLAKMMMMMTREGLIFARLAEKSLMMIKKFGRRRCGPTMTVAV